MPSTPECQYLCLLHEILSKSREKCLKEFIVKYMSCQYPYIVVQGHITVFFFHVLQHFHTIGRYVVVVMMVTVVIIVMMVEVVI